MTQRFGALTFLLTFAIFAISIHSALAATRHKQTFRGKHAESATGADHKQASARFKDPNRAPVAN
jgi:hypothetical protein